MSDLPTLLAPPAMRRPSELGALSYLSGLLPPRDLIRAYLLTALGLVGLAGLQHLYLGRRRRAVLWMLTFGLLGVGTILDLATMRAQVEETNGRRAAGILR